MEEDKNTEKIIRNATKINEVVCVCASVNADDKDAKWSESANTDKKKYIKIYLVLEMVIFVVVLAVFQCKSSD